MRRLVDGAAASRARLQSRLDKDALSNIGLAMSRMSDGQRKVVVADDAEKR